LKAGLQLRDSPRIVFHRRLYYRLWLPESNGYPAEEFRVLSTLSIPMPNAEDNKSF
jgi:hypothetical protein